MCPLHPVLMPCSAPVVLQIPRYILTLHELLAHTPHEHVERNSLDYAKSKLEELSRSDPHCPSLPITSRPFPFLPILFYPFPSWHWGPFVWISSQLQFPLLPSG